MFIHRFFCCSFLVRQCVDHRSVASIFTIRVDCFVSCGLCFVKLNWEEEMKRAQ